MFGVFPAGDEEMDEGNLKNPFPGFPGGTGRRGAPTVPQMPGGGWDEPPVPWDALQERRGSSPHPTGSSRCPTGFSAGDTEIKIPCPPLPSPALC